MEDHLDVRTAIRYALEGDGYEVIATPDATAALPLVPHLEKLGRKPPIQPRVSAIKKHGTVAA